MDCFASWAGSTNELLDDAAARREHDVAAWQRFSDYAELESRRAQADISIPMPYRIALLHAS